MSDKLKNIITNILGLLMVIVSVYAIIFNMIDIPVFSILMTVALALFLFKSSTSVTYIKKFLDKKLK
jgi:hypothetical protein